MPRSLPVLLLLPAVMASALLSSGALCAEPVNPFSRPVLEPVPAPGVPVSESIDRPQLRGVIVAGSQSIANLNGTLLAIGEETSGYRLDSVTEEGATFVHDGEPVTLYLEDPATEDQS